MSIQEVVAAPRPLNVSQELFLVRASPEEEIGQFPDGPVVFAMEGIGLSLRGFVSVGSFAFDRSIPRRGPNGDGRPDPARSSFWPLPGTA